MSDTTKSEPQVTATDEAAGAESFDALSAVAELDEALSEADAAPAVEQVGESYTEILESELAELTALLSSKDAELTAALEEQDKSRARVEKEASRNLDQRTRKILLKFLDVLDNLDRALTSARGVDHNPAVIEGIELVRKSFIDTLGTFGVRHDPAMGETFDPAMHDAMSMAATDDAAMDGKVIAVIREGFSMGETILRPAGVVVGKKS